MKNKTTYTYLICISFILVSIQSFGQIPAEIKFKLLNNPLEADKTLITVSTFINAKQSNPDGIHFTLIVKNNSSNDISMKNIVNQLSVALYNERGLDIAVPNDGLKEYKINRASADRKWKFRSESVVLDQVSINGRKESGDFKALEYTQIPAGGNWKVNLILKNVKQVETRQDVQNRVLKATTNLIPGKYKLELHLLMFPQQNKSEEKGRLYVSPFIDIDYTR